MEEAIPLYNKQEHIKDRMLKRAARSWGGNEYATEASFDPLVGMLVAACAAELENLSREVAESRLRVSEKLLDLMVPDVNAGVLPAHALVSAMPVEPELLVNTNDSLYINTAQLGRAAEQQLYFSPAGTFKLVQGQLSTMLHAGGIVRFDQQGNRTDILRVRNGQGVGAHELWLGLRLPKGLEKLRDLSLCFNYRGRSFARNFYYLLRNARWSASGMPLEAQPGFAANLNQEDYLLRIFDRSTLRQHAQLIHIRNFYEEQFVNLELQQEHLQTGCPQALNEMVQQLPAEIQADMQSQVWLKVSFMQHLSPAVFEELFCSMNTFPVLNLSKVSKVFRSRRHLNLFALSDEDYFFDLESVEDSEGRFYHQSKADKVADVEDNFYILRSTGVESFDSRAASEQTIHLLEKLKNESASFNFLDKVSFSNDLKSLHQIVARLETNLDKLPRFASTVYLYLSTLQEGLSVFVNYRCTAGSAANNIKPGTMLSLYMGSHLQQGSIIMLTPTQGGRSRMGREDRMAVFRKALLTRNRIVSEEDLKAFCHVQFGNKLKSVTVQKGAQKEFSAKGGFMRTIDIHLVLNENNRPAYDELHFLCKDLQVSLEKKSAGVFPFRIFLDKQLIEF